MNYLKQFLHGGQPNAYVRVGKHIELYCRKGFHLVGGQVVPTFDVAKVEIDEHYRGEGLFRQFLLDLKALLERPEYFPRFTCIFVESVVNERLMTFLPSVGFTLLPNTIPPCFVQMLTAEKPVVLGVDLNAQFHALKKAAFFEGWKMANEKAWTSPEEAWANSDAEE